jgi:hypothetical protein
MALEYDKSMTFFGTLIHLFVPHHTNNHRPKVLHIDALAGYVLLFAIFNFSVRVIHKEMPNVLGYATDIHVEQLLAATNAQRQAAGLSPVVLNAKLSQAAAAKAADMFAKNYWAHNSPTGGTPWDFINGSGYRYTVAGENLAKNFSTSTGVVEAWMASPTHKANIVKPNYKEIGFAVVNGVLQGEETTLVVQMFGSSNDAIAVATTPTPAPLVQKAEAASQEPLPTSPPVEVAPATAPATITAIEHPPTAFLGVTLKPLINIPTLTRDIVFVFAGVLIGVLMLDVWIISKKRIVRVAGHNIAHFFFLSAVVIAVSLVNRGALL